MKKICEVCGNEFNALRERNKYCGKECQYESQRYGNAEQSEKTFKEKFETKHQNHEYISDYTPEGYFKSRCKTCGSIQERSVQCVRRDREIKCNNCIDINRERKRLIEILNKYVLANERQLLRQQKLLSYEEAIRAKKTKVCKECGKEFISPTNKKKYCSSSCLKKRLNRTSEIRKRCRFKNTKIDWSITLDKLIKRDNNICHICGGKCNKKDYKIVNGNFVVGREYPSIDHVIPASKGGEHSWNNVKLAHHHCNTIKRNYDIYETGTGQLTMAI